MFKKAIWMLACIASLAMIPRFRLDAQIGSPRSEQTQQERELEQRRQREANLKRQQDIREDTQRLYQLAGELKDAVDKSNENMLSLDVMKKAEEVEKLAKKVKEKMKEGAGRPITPEPLPPPQPHPPFSHGLR